MIFFFFLSSNIDTGELCAYFSKHLGPFKDIFCALEDLNNAASKALVKTAEVRFYISP